MTTIGIVAGEPSGDALGASLIAAVRRRVPGARFVGIAGPRMQREGCEAWFPMETLAVRGLVEVMGRLPELLRVRRELFRRLVAEPVQLFVGVDAPDFNLGLERKLKRRRIRTMHFVSPSVWAWRQERIRRIAQCVDHMLVLFPFEPALYERAGVAVTFVGHPLAQHAADAGSRRRARDLLQLAVGDPIVALLPGSRTGEIEMHADALLDAAILMHRERPALRFIVPLATRATRDLFEAVLVRREAAGLPLTMLYGHATEALQAADVALVASGTATLEAALARCPHVVFYRVNAVTARLVRRRLLLPWVALPNVLAGRFVVPELLQDDATPVNLAHAALNLLDDGVTRARMEVLFGRMGDDLRVETGPIAAGAVRDELVRAGVSC